MKEKVSLSSLNLKRKVWIAVSLITLLPLIIFVYYFSNFCISPAAIFILGFIVFLGWWIVFEVFFSVQRIYSRTKEALEKIGQGLPPNELKSLESAIALLSSKMKNSLEELKEYGQKTEELNREVSKKVFTLSTLLEANNLFSQEVPAEEIIQLLLRRLREILKMQVVFCSLKIDGRDGFTVVLGMDSSRIEVQMKREVKSLFALEKIVVGDKKNELLPHLNWLRELGPNIALAPVISETQNTGIIAVASSEDNFIFSPDDLDTLNLFSQNIALVWEHKRLSSRIENLEIIDHLTGLYNEKFIGERLDEELKRAIAYQRPCGFLLMQVQNYSEYQRKEGIIESERLLEKLGKTFKESLRPIDIAGRIGPDKLAAILIEKNKRQCKVVAKELKEKLEGVFKDKIKLVFSIAESPLDGSVARQLLLFAQSHLPR